ncbi:MAG: hypothetical protein JKX86_02145 [Verrucomicrobiales bacterium]|nr:hypothetical protein [Verrucomicrobiales bacterium]
MNEIITNVGGAYFGAYSSSGKSSSDKSFSRVLDSNNQPIRGLWRRRKLFYARMSVTDATGRHTQRRVPLKAKTLIQAQAELENLRQSRTVLPQRQTSPIWSNYWHTYISQIHQLKRPRTVDSEKLHCEHWAEAIGKLNIHLIRTSHLLQYRSAKLKAGWAGRTVNLAITVLSNVLNHAQDNGMIDTLPTTGLKPIRWKLKKRPLFTRGQIEAKFALLPLRTLVTGNFWPIMCASWRGAVHELPRHSTLSGQMWTGGSNNSPSARTA